MPQITAPDNLCCPLDGRLLESESGRFVCPDGHAFDLARQGYLNLLLVQHKRSRAPGDSKAMVQARTRFLDSGRYAGIAEALADEALARLGERSHATILDAGCGDGYYTQHLAATLAERWRGESFSMTGLDISRPAIQAAARRSRDIRWVVGTNRCLPAAAGSVDLLLSLFGYPQYAGFHAVLRPGGVLILADAGPRHLIELRELLYDEVRIRPAPGVDAAIAAGFELAHTQKVAFRMERLQGDEILDLATMTPHFFRASRQKREALERVQSLNCSVDVVFRSLVKPVRPASGAGRKAAGSPEFL
ncbi:MAG: methyltransferase domain-containing protein [Gammaproteobacteria bacterium]|jgi:23S rRNA (guanine745-N1)-methyltransferase